MDFLPSAVLISIVPGANQLLGLSNAIRSGASWALIGILARLAAFALLIGLVVLGLGAALAQSPGVLTVIKWSGIAYLVWIGVAALRSKPETFSVVEGEAVRTDRWRIPRQEFTVAIINPKALLLFAALLPQFTSGGRDAELRIALLGLAYMGVEATIGSLYVGAGRVLRWRFRSYKGSIARRVDQLSGICILALAGALAVNSV
ncbi:LysE family translocator [Streptomyces sp. NBC_01808]|uniref:LysE family translocator n=1 Tax=Streptomyces sp. NBC_01808 TaxID=2975947 RepID=UPI002DD859E5|nr:LysE family translocator [Streptomyces sp. NBC_01808]WSA36259.1 LysE family translocator [Streptomyces sp. NBC_01808]